MSKLAKRLADLEAKIQAKRPEPSGPPDLSPLIADLERVERGEFTSLDPQFERSMLALYAALQKLAELEMTEAP